ncbi:MAG TPA: hypothetical protein VJ484_01450 [Lysobacter sp.]|nr:hypothetical protein [Lysobacter sp.]
MSIIRRIFFRVAPRAGSALADATNASRARLDPVLRTSAFNSARAKHMKKGISCALAFCTRQRERNAMRSLRSSCEADHYLYPPHQPADDRQPDWASHQSICAKLRKLFGRSRALVAVREMRSTIVSARSSTV